MTLDMLRIACSEFNVLPIDTFLIFDLPARRTDQREFPIDAGFIGYLLEVRLKSTNSDVRTVITDSAGKEIMVLAETPDFPEKFLFYPFMNFRFNNSLRVTTINNSGASSNHTLIIRGVFVPKAESKLFENVLMKHYGLRECETVR